MCGINQKRFKENPKKDIFRFKGLSPNEIGEGSDLTVRGIPSRRAPERQRWTFPSHTIISALRLSTVSSHTHVHTDLHTITAGQVLCTHKKMCSLKITHTLGFFFFFTYSNHYLISAGSASSWVYVRPLSK